MTVMNFMKNEEYIGIVEDYLKGVKRIEKLKEHDSKESRIQNEKKELASSLIDRTRKFYSKRNKAIDKNINRIKNSYKNKKTKYEDPAVELLRRQDFDMEVSSLTDLQLQEVAKDTSRELSRYELNKLGTLLKGKDGHGAVLSRLSLQKPPYSNDVNYQKYVREKEELDLIRPQQANTALYFPKGDSMGMFLIATVDSIDRKDAAQISLIKNTLREGIDWMKENSTEVDHQTLITEKKKEEKEEEVKFNIYKDDDPRIDRDSEEYDVVTRFKYLKERYHDPEKSVYDPSSQDYDPYEHKEYMEQLHEKATANSETSEEE